MQKSFALALICCLVVFSRKFSDSRADVAQSTSSGVDFIALPGHPSGVVCSADGNSVFVSLNKDVAVLRRSGRKFALQQLIPVPNSPFGMVMTHDAKTLIVATDATVVLLDVGRMISGAPNPLEAEFNDGSDSPIYVNVTSDDKILFVSNEADQSISVVDLERVRAQPKDKHAIIGKIPVGVAPIALTFSPDGRWLYTTSQGAPPAWGWAKTETPEGLPVAQGTELETPGAVVVVDVAKAKIDPAHSVVARVPAGDSPVRMTISHDGRTVYVTARGSDKVMAFDAEKLVSDPTHSRLTTIAVGSEPVPLALIKEGKVLVVGNSNRFKRNGDADDTLSVLEVGNGANIRSIGTIPAGVFPREMCVSPDGRTLYVSNFRSDLLQVIDVEHFPVGTN
jgi:DNA-binding beta-propeller fold protein YncE